MSRRLIIGAAVAICLLVCMVLLAGEYPQWNPKVASVLAALPATELGETLLTSSGQSGAAVGAFDSYAFAQVWANSYCNSHCTDEQCTNKSGTYQEQNLTIHGLWPQYNDASAHGGFGYPQFCGNFSVCNVPFASMPATCLPAKSSLNFEQFEIYEPGYTSGNYFLADHEWPKHGSCSGLSQASYFNQALSLEKQLELDASKVWAGQSGKSVSLATVVAAYGGANMVSLTCYKGALQQVLTCWGKDALGNPSTRTPCPSTVSPSNCPAAISLPLCTCSI